MPVCESIGYVYQAFLALDLFALFILIIVAHFVEGLLHSLWRLRGRVVLRLPPYLHPCRARHPHYPLLRLAFSAVDLSYQFKRALDQLKKLQVQMLSSNPDLFEQYYLRASIWDGKRFGIREPLSQIHLDALFWSTLRYRTGIVSIFVLVLLGYGLAGVGSAGAAVAKESLCSCSVELSQPMSNSIIRRRERLHGAGGRAGPALTNWHCLQMLWTSAACCIAEPTRPVPAQLMCVNRFRPLAGPVAVS